MISYKTCTDVTMQEIYSAFSLGFSDYMIPLTMAMDVFAARFFGPEGNELNLSYIAMEDEQPIGLILGGIRIFDGIKTLRCGALCITPEHRGKGVSHKLLELHKAAGAEAHCKQLFLEVIKGNDRAVRFYEGYDYRPVYTLKYYSVPVQAIAANNSYAPYTCKEVSFETLDSFRRNLPDCHINWQSETDYYAGSSKEAILGAFDQGQLLALIAMSPQGKINFVWVDPAYRHQGLGRFLIHKAAAMQKVEKLNICLPSNAVLEGFIRKLGFEKQTIEQFEMYLPL